MEIEYYLKFTEIGFIGGGAFGKVFIAHTIANVDECYAVKKIPFCNNQADDVENEAIFLRDLDSDYVVKYFRHWTEINYYLSREIQQKLESQIYPISSCNKLRGQEFNNLLHIQMQLCQTSLRTVINKCLKSQISIENNNHQYLNDKGFYFATELLMQLVEGIKFLQDKHVMHLDLKPDNILLSLELSNHIVKIADFGSAIYEQKCEEADISCKGTLQYKAPELESGRCCKSSDLFSLGIIAEEMYCMELENFPHFNTEKRNIVNLIKKLQSHDHNNRGTCDEILENKCKFFTNIRNHKSLQEFLQEYIK